MEDLSLFDQYPVFQYLSYIITVIIGGVGYKYLNLILSHKKEKDQASAESNQLLIENLQNRINNLTAVVDNFDKERKEIHEREIERTKELERTKGEVRLLIEKVKYLEEKLEEERRVNAEYRKKYGELNV